ncbi:MAG: hypothetical protein JO283_17805 [Bradyrhizobium sp.]|nr:hypothetical protein [Bradyrhizobium sp.]
MSSRLSGATGGRALTLRFNDAIAPDGLGRHEGGAPASNGLLPAKPIC